MRAGLVAAGTFPSWTVGALSAEVADNSEEYPSPYSEVRPYLNSPGDLLQVRGKPSVRDWGGSIHAASCLLAEPKLYVQAFWDLLPLSAKHWRQALDDKMRAELEAYDPDATLPVLLWGMYRRTYRFASTPAIKIVVVAMFPLLLIFLPISIVITGLAASYKSVSWAFGLFRSRYSLLRREDEMFGRAR